MGNTVNDSKKKTSGDQRRRFSLESGGVLRNLVYFRREVHSQKHWPTCPVTAHAHMFSFFSHDLFPSTGRTLSTPQQSSQRQRKWKILYNASEILRRTHSLTHKVWFVRRIRQCTATIHSHVALRSRWTSTSSYLGVFCNMPATKVLEKFPHSLSMLQTENSHRIRKEKFLRGRHSILLIHAVRIFVTSPIQTLAPLTRQSFTI